MSRAPRLHAQAEIYRIRKSGLAWWLAPRRRRSRSRDTGCRRQALLRTRICAVATQKGFKEADDTGGRRASHGQAMATVQVKLIVAGTTAVLAAMVTVTV
jgi:hypothetical protein